MHFYKDQIVPDKGINEQTDIQHVGDEFRMPHSNNEQLLKIETSCRTATLETVRSAFGHGERLYIYLSKKDAVYIETGEHIIPVLLTDHQPTTAMFIWFWYKGSLHVNVN